MSVSECVIMVSDMTYHCHKWCSLSNCSLNALNALRVQTFIIIHLHIQCSNISLFRSLVRPSHSLLRSLPIAFDCQNVWLGLELHWLVWEKSWTDSRLGIRAGIRTAIRADIRAQRRAKATKTRRLLLTPLYESLYKNFIIFWRFATILFTFLADLKLRAFLSFSLYSLNH